MSLEGGSAARHRSSVLQPAGRGATKEETLLAETLKKRAEALEFVKTLEKKVKVSDGISNAGMARRSYNHRETLGPQQSFDRIEE